MLMGRLRDLGCRRDGLVVGRPRDRDDLGRGAGPVHAVFAIHLRADQIVSGTAVIFIAWGLTGYLYNSHYGYDGTPGTFRPFRRSTPPGSATFLRTHLDSSSPTR